MDHIQRLCSLTKAGRKGGRDFILDYFSKRDNLHKKLKVILVTGTAGKGSTSAMIAKGLQDAGYKVGLFTSPHLLRLNERFRINGHEISSETLEKHLETLMEEIPDLSFSEYLMITAVNFFFDEEVDYLVCEVFVGGVFDPTNIFDLEALVLTSVGIDHKEFLGNDIKEILLSELGLLQKDVPLFTHILDGMVKDEILRKGAVLGSLDSVVETNLKGDFQKRNASLALGVLKYLGGNEETTRKSLMDVSWPGRVQYVEKNIIVDCAHNELAFDELFSYVESLNFNKLHILFAMSSNHSLEEFERHLWGSKVIFTKANIFKAMHPRDYAPIGSEIIENPKEAFEKLREELGDDDILLVCGSVFLAADILSLYSCDE